ncbi:MAG: hypothetical protein KGL44_04705 [Sphingomonadales bacterium]|nr:hypothetical protein [Sphingomonadales bacterium]
MGWIVWQYQDEAAAVMLLLAFVLAMLRGAAAERAMALALFCQLPLFILDQLLTGGRDPYTSYRQLEPDLFAIDLVLLALYLAVALRANRVYPLWIAGAQLIAVLAHVVKIVSGDLVPRAYASLVMVPTHFQIVMLIAGTIAHLRREAQYGDYPSWRQQALPAGTGKPSEHDMPAASHAGARV